MDIRTTQLLGRLVDFAVDRGLIESIDRCYYTNRLLECMHMDAPAPAEPESFPVPETATPILEPLVDIAVARGLCGETGEQRDLFSAKLMGIVTPSPREVRRSFEMTLHAQGIEAATKWFYRLCRNCDYIKVDRVARNAHFFEETGAGRLEITINLSKPEKDPRDIAAQRNAPKTGYPKCMLCAENPGYAGRVGFPARQNHRMLPLLLDGKLWFFQYSPYLYYNEHCIVINNEHVPMRISHDTFVRLFDFVDRFPHYFLGSNADLPIVGGSILSHDHFQGGNHVFPLDLARGAHSACFARRRRGGGHSGLAYELRKAVFGGSGRIDPACGRIARGLARIFRSRMRDPRRDRSATQYADAHSPQAVGPVCVESGSAQ